MTVFDSNYSSRLTGRDDVVWIGASGAEFRAVGSLRVLRAHNQRIAQALLIEYRSKTYVDPSGARQTANKTDRELRRLLDGAGCSRIESVQPSPHAALAFKQVLRGQLDSVPSSALICVDISSLTRAHLVGLAQDLRSGELSRFKESILFTYSSPSTYDPKGTSAGGWERTLVCPAAAGGRLGNVGRSVGVILLGHEAERLAAALAEFEPSSGRLFVVSTPGVPEFGSMAEVHHRAFFSWWRNKDGASAPVILDVTQTRQFAAEVAAACENALRSDSPVVFYPFGPKPLCLAGIRQALEMTPKRTWFVYPVPNSYSTAHTAGLRSCSLYDSDLTYLGSEAIPLS